jgi:pyruvate,orthophosphate dikinase
VTLVYRFADGCEDKMLLGNKGANLVTMASRLKLPVPSGFALSTEAYAEFMKTKKLPMAEIEKSLADLEKKSGKKLGKGLAVSVRSSAPVSMPGMMDTVLDVRNKEQIISSIKKIFGSWDNPRAIEYRRLNKIEGNVGTAAVIQEMVFGDQDKKSGTGVIFTRNAITGEKRLFGEYMPVAKGEDLVSGVKTPGPVEDLKKAMPKVYDELEAIARRLEKYFLEMQDVEFTVESGKLFILQTRKGKRGGQAAVKIAVDLVKEGLISREEAVMRITPDDLRMILHKRAKPTKDHKPIAKGLNAAPGAAIGRAVFDPKEAAKWVEKGEKVILVRPETIPDDIQGIAVAEGVLTSRGGLTSHAAIVTRAMGKPCICGAEDLNIDLTKKLFKVANKVVRQGDVITIDGTEGKIYVGPLPVEEAEATKELNELLSWADDIRRLGVKANADTADMMKVAKKYGAEGVGLCRTERQFSMPDRLEVIREFIMANTVASKAKALKKLEVLQKKDFTAIFKELNGLPVIIRLLDLPLHEFLPPAHETNDPRVKARIDELKEINPMMGHRGVRLGITNPEIYQMQIKAISEAKAEVGKTKKVNVSIMIPQIMSVEELLAVKKYMKNSKIPLGIMVETGRACAQADNLSKVADFFSFGTNDLTQSVCALSREDAEKKFLAPYLKMGILKTNPFETIDSEGVGRLMDIAVKQARAQKKNFDIGVCGEQGGDPPSIQFFHKIGLSYVSCSAFRVPAARLVAAQAALQEKSEKAKKAKKAK